MQKARQCTCSKISLMGDISYFIKDILQNIYRSDWSVTTLASLPEALCRLIFWLLGLEESEHVV